MYKCFFFSTFISFFFNSIFSKLNINTIPDSSDIKEGLLSGSFSSSADSVNNCFSTVHCIYPLSLINNLLFLVDNILQKLHFKPKSKFFSEIFQLQRFTN
jgi:hypothetical protein